MSRLFVVATPIGNMSDISPRAVEILGGVSFIACEDTRTSSILLNKLGIKSELISYHKFNEKSRAAELVSRMTDNEIDAAVISDAGTPCVSDPGAEFVRLAAEAGIEIFGIPGACAAVTALSISGFEGGFAFLGFLPRKKSELKEYFQTSLPTGIENHIFYESPKRILDTLSVLISVYPEAPLVLCNDLTKKFEKTYRGTVSEVFRALSENENNGLGEYAAVLHLRIAPTPVISMPAKAALLLKLADGVTLREAKEQLSESYSRNELYAASLDVKKLLDSRN